MKKEKTIVCMKVGMAVAILVVLGACSSTSTLEEGEKLYVGTKSIKYTNYENNDHFIATKQEVNASLAVAPNGAFMGSSSLRLVPWRLWLYNATYGKKNFFAKWIHTTFGDAPRILSEVNPKLRALVAKTTLNSNGYFRCTTNFEEIPQKNPKTSKVSYTMNLGPLFTYDSISYVNYPIGMDTLIRKSSSQALIKKGDGFSASNLSLERQRLATLFRNNGFYYYNAAYSSYLADTIAKPTKVQLRLQLADSLDNKVYKKWYIGKTDIYIRKSYQRETPDSVKRRSLTVHFNGKRSPVRARTILGDMKLRRGMMYSQELYSESLSRLTANNTFSMVDISFEPKDTTAVCDTLNMRLDCILDKPWSFTLEGNLTGKTTNRVGPGAKLQITKKNVFRGAENLSFDIWGSYEWQIGGDGSASDLGINSYDYGGDITLEFPRLLLPSRIRRRWDHKPSTTIKASNQVIKRGSYFNRHIMSGELSYSFQPTDVSRHIFSPLIFEYEYMNDMSDEFYEYLEEHPSLIPAMEDQFIPKIRYTYRYTSPAKYRNPITWETTISESGNIISGIYAACGRKWNEKDKNLFKNPYAQFLKFETDFSKKWSIGEKSALVGHVNAGIIYSYGNSDEAPYSEEFYVGGANSIRAFAVRTIGPGRYHSDEAVISYLTQVGDIKFVANLEYRPHLFGNFYGAAFLDIGNVWTMKDQGEDMPDSQFKWNSLLKDMAIGTGIGLRYDLSFFVIRLDWGIGLHMPYDTGHSGFFNINRFKDCQSLHLAIGYPF